MCDETRLIRETLDGNSDAFGQLVRHYQDRLYTSMAHILGDLDEAEDVAQEAFVQAFVRLATFKQTSTFYTWLYRIAFNVAMSRKRRKRPEVSMDANPGETGDEPLDPEDNPSQRLLRQERRGRIRTALAALSEEFRAALVLREVEGCGYETMADILDISIGTVRSRLHRARSALRDELRRMGDAE